MRKQHRGWTGWIVIWGLWLLALTLPADGAWAARPVLRFAQISDNHYMIDGVDRNQRLLKESPLLLTDALQQLQAVRGLDFILFSGDFVNVPRPQDFQGFFTTLRRHTRRPVYLVLGNHDVGIQPQQRKQDTLDAIKGYTRRGFNQPGKGYYAFSPTPQVLMIVLDGTVDRKVEGKVSANGFLPSEQLAWLETTLKRAAQRKQPPTVFVTLHFPPVEPAPSTSHRIVEPDHTRLMQILEASPLVSAVFTGHYHAARIRTVNGIHYFCAPALVEYPNAFRLFTLYDDGTLTAQWQPTRLKELQQKSMQASPWPQAALGNPDRDHGFSGPLRYFPRRSVSGQPSPAAATAR
jgi:3',5'-cyclic AMP phosphodiesterase CpdA